MLELGILFGVTFTIGAEFILLIMAAIIMKQKGGKK